MFKKIIGKIKEYSPMICAISIMLLIIPMLIVSTFGIDIIGDIVPLGGRSGGGDTPDTIASYWTTAPRDGVIYAGAAFLDRVIIGSDVATSSFIISDHATSGTGNVVFHITGSTLQGVYEVGLDIVTGITAWATSQTNGTIIYYPK